MCAFGSCYTAHEHISIQAPDDDYFSVHIRIVGDWTTALSKACLTDQDELQDPSKMPRFEKFFLTHEHVRWTVCCIVVVV